MSVVEQDRLWERFLTMIRKKITKWAYLAALLLGKSTIAFAESYELSALVDRALSRADLILSRKTSVEEKKHAALQMNVWQNPSLNMGIGAKFVSPSVGPIIQAGISQPITFPGKQDLRFAIADADRDLAEVTLQQSEAVISADVVNLSYGYMISKRKSEFADLRRRRYELIQSYLSGRTFASPQAQATKLIIKERLRSVMTQTALLQASERETLSKLNFYLDLPNTDKLDVMTPWLTGKFELDYEEQLARSEDSFDIRAKTIEVSRSKKEGELVDREWWPDLVVSGFYGYEGAGQPEHMFGLGFSLPMPVWDRNHRQEARFRHKISANESLLTHAKKQIHRDLEQAINRYDAARKVVEQYPRELIDSLEKKLSDSENAFRKGRLDILLFLDLEDQLNETIMGVLDAQHGLVEQITALHALIPDKDILNHIARY